mgnify:CR=1 FL=1
MWPMGRRRTTAWPLRLPLRGSQRMEIAIWCRNGCDRSLSFHKRSSEGQSWLRRSSRDVSGSSDDLSHVGASKVVMIRMNASKNCSQTLMLQRLLNTF